jgi:hypothetical protein
MATRIERLAQFNQGTPPADKLCEVICEDSSGTYILPYHCIYVEGDVD